MFILIFPYWSIFPLFFFFFYKIPPAIFFPSYHSNLAVLFPLYDTIKWNEHTHEQNPLFFFLFFLLSAPQIRKRRPTPATLVIYNDPNASGNVMFPLQNTKHPHYTRAHLSGECAQRGLGQTGVFWVKAGKCTRLQELPNNQETIECNLKQHQQQKSTGSFI